MHREPFYFSRLKPRQIVVSNDADLVKEEETEIRDEKSLNLFVDLDSAIDKDENQKKNFTACTCVDDDIDDIVGRKSLACCSRITSQSGHANANLNLNLNLNLAEYQHHQEATQEAKKGQTDTRANRNLDDGQNIEKNGKLRNRINTMFDVEDIEDKGETEIRITRKFDVYLTERKGEPQNRLKRKFDWQLTEDNGKLPKKVSTIFHQKETEEQGRIENSDLKKLDGETRNTVERKLDGEVKETNFIIEKKDKTVFDGGNAEENAGVEDRYNTVFDEKVTREIDGNGNRLHRMFCGNLRGEKSVMEERESRKCIADGMLFGENKLTFSIDTMEIQNVKVLGVKNKNQDHNITSPCPCPSGDCQVMLGSIEKLAAASKLQRYDRKLSLLYNFISLHGYGDETIKGSKMENGCQFVLLNFPSGLYVNGFDYVPSWNCIKPGFLFQGMHIAHDIICDSGWVSCIHTVEQFVEVKQAALVVGLELWRSFTLLCDKPVYRELKEPRAKIHTLLISMFHRRGMQRPKPYYIQAGELNHHQRSLSRDVLFESVDLQDWDYKADGTPWRGGAQRSQAIWKFLLLAFTKYSDTVVDLIAGTGGFIKAASELGRHCLGVESDAAIFHHLLSSYVQTNGVNAFESML